MSESIAAIAIRSVQNAQIAFCKFITANDTGDTGGHQYGYHMQKNAWPLMFDTAGVKGENKESLTKIRWQNQQETESRFIYYGKGTRNEYRLTRFGKNFPFLDSEFTGSLLVLTKQSPHHYDGFVLSTDEEMEDFFEAVGISASETNRIIPKPTEQTVIQTFQDLFDEYILGTKEDFPDTISMSRNARTFYNQLNGITETAVLKDADSIITKWIETEYALFKSFEASRYKEYVNTALGDMDKLVEVANTILQRRKSRAGKSLENHLDYIFNLHKLRFERNAVTENNKKPDFLFPSAKDYHDKNFLVENLVVLGSKTTCKDRWRQVVNEADRASHKYLCTLQQGNTDNQLKEMHDAGIRLVVPHQYISTYPANHRHEILSLDGFISLVKGIQTAGS
jgi:type II restriction enzyme